jgi:hypothetical protein
VPADESRQPTSKKKTPAQKVADLRREQARQDRRRARMIWVPVTATLVVLGGAVAWSLSTNSAAKDLSAVQSFTVQQGHTDAKVTYEQSPPAGGEHAPAWLNCGVYDSPVPNENAVHSLEHGAVWVTYKPDLPAEQVSALKELLSGPYDLLSPYPGLEAPVVASAWGKQLTLDSSDDARLPAFLKAYRQGAQAPEPGAACTGGTDGTDGTTAAPSMDAPVTAP